MVGRHDLHAVEIPLLLQKLAEVDVAGDASELLRRTLLRVVGLDDILRHIATGPNAGELSSPIGIAERLPHAVAETRLVPVDVVRRVLHGIADGRDLHVRNRDPSQQLADSLSAAPDVRQRDLVARGDMAATTEHVSRHDAERCDSGSGRSQELATIDVVFGCHGDLLSGRGQRAAWRSGSTSRAEAGTPSLLGSHPRTLLLGHLGPNMAHAGTAGYSASIRPADLP